MHRLRPEDDEVEGQNLQADLDAVLDSIYCLAPI
jgi:hypothetical protein